MHDSATRRRLLKLTASGLAGSLLVPACAEAQPSAASGPRAIGKPMPGNVPLPPTPPGRPAEGSVGLAIVGLGGYALRQIMPSVLRSQRCHVAAVVSGNREKAMRVASAYGVARDAVYSYETFNAIARDSRIDAVYIVLPSGLHADWTEKAFAAGKHVICEKPMALSSTECERMIAASRAADRKLMIGYRCHFEPYNVRAMALMRESAVGALRVIRTDQHYVMGATTPAENWRVDRALAGGGPLEDFGIYGLQSALYLSGENPVSVSATTSTPAGDPRFSQILAHVAYQFDFPSGAVAHLSTSYDGAGANRVEVRGDRGVLLMDPATGYSGNTLSLRRGANAEQLALGESEAQFTGMLDHFAAGVRDNAPILTPGEMGLRDLRLMEAIYASAQTATRVRLDPDGRMRA